MKNYKLHFYASKYLILCIFMIISACSMHNLPPEKYYNYGNLRTQKTNNDVRLFLFFIDDEFVKADKSKPSKKYSELTKNQALLLKKHLQKRRYCLDKKDRPKFVITERQNPVYQEIQDNNNQIKLINIAPLGFFGKCVDE